MSGALVGMRIDGHCKWLRLHGERRCASILADVLAFLHRFDEARLPAYARCLHPVTMAHEPFPSPATRDDLRVFFAGFPQAPVCPASWAEIFECFNEIRGWIAGFPYMPAAALHACGDVDWGVLIDLDASQLLIYDNRHIRVPWQALDEVDVANCTLALSAARQLEAGDLNLIEDLLNHHAPNGNEAAVSLPVQDMISPALAGPAANWQMRLQLHRGRVGLMLERAGIRLQLAQAHGLCLDTPGLGPMLCQVLPQDLLALVRAIYGPSARLSQVARVQAERERLPFDPGSHGLPLLDLGLQASNGLNFPLGPDFFDVVRARFLAAGMTLQGWRFLLRQQPQVLRFLLQYYPPSHRILGDFARFVNLIAMALQNEPLQLQRAHVALRGVERILDRTRGRPSSVREENARIFLRAIMRARLSAEEEANLAHEAQDVSDFVYTHATILKKATWRSLRRRSEHWHRTLLIAVDPNKDVRWPSLLPVYSTGPFTAVELDCGYLLAEEGLEQRHCVGTYVHACSSGASRIFSLRRSGKRVATIELQRNHAGDWVLVQIRGKANAAVRDPDVLAAGQAVAQAYARAYARQNHTCSDSHQPARAFSSIHAHQPEYLIHRQEHWTG